MKYIKKELSNRYGEAGKKQPRKKKMCGNIDLIYEKACSGSWSSQYQMN